MLRPNNRGRPSDGRDSEGLAADRHVDCCDRAVEKILLEQVGLAHGKALAKTGGTSAPMRNSGR
jgi:hypothetical protein